MQQPRRRIRQNLFGDVDLRAVKPLQAIDLAQRQQREQPQEATDIAVVRIAPELPIIIGRYERGIEPNGAGGGLAHFGARCGGDQRRRQRVELRGPHPPAKIEAVDDIAPLIRAAHLQRAAMQAVQFDEIIGLQTHVIEFEEGQFLVALEAHLDRVHRQHAIDREMLADIAQKLDIIELRQPLRVIWH